MSILMLKCRRFSFQRHQGYDLLIGDCQDKNSKKEDETVEELKTVDVKQERVSSDLDDVTITFVEEGFPKKLKKKWVHLLQHNL